MWCARVKRPATHATGRLTQGRYAWLNDRPWRVMQTMFNGVSWSGGCAVSLSILGTMTAASGVYLMSRALKLKGA